MHYRRDAEPPSPDNPLTPTETLAVLTWPWKPFAAPSEAEVDEIERLKALGQIPDREIHQWRKSCPDAAKILAFAAERLWARAHKPTLKQFGGLEKLVAAILSLLPDWDLDKPDWDVLRVLLLQKGYVRPPELAQLTLPAIRDHLILASHSNSQATPESTPAGSHRFRRKGRIWDLQFGQEACPMPHSPGLGYIHTLLSNPASRHVGLTVVQMDHVAPEEMPDVQEALNPAFDRDAIRRCQKRLRAIIVEVEAARSAGNEATIARLAKEAKDIRRLMELGRVDPDKDAEEQNEWMIRDAGPAAGHHKRFGAIRKTLARVYKSIRESGGSSLAAHFEVSVQPSRCRFYYRPAEPIEWET